MIKERRLIPELLFFQEGPGVRNNQYTNTGVKLLNVANLVNGKVDLSTSERYIAEEEAYGKYKHFLVNEGDLIIASSGIKVEYFDKKMGFVNAAQLPLCMNTSTIRFRTLNEKILKTKYFMYFLKSKDFKRQLTSQITGSAQLNFGPSHLKKMNVPMVDILAQKRVCETLDTLGKISEMQKVQLAELDILVKARFVEMFGDPVINLNHMKEMNLSELGQFGRGVSKFRPRNDPKLLGGEYPLIQTGDVANAGLYITSFNNTYSDLGLKQSKMWKKGTLCITIAANIAKTAILTFDACFPDSIVGFLANDKANNVFIHYWFSFFQEILENKAPESAQKNLNLRILSDIKVIVPSIEFQNQFAAFVQQVDKSKVAIQKSLDETQVLYDSLMQKYFG